MKLKTQTLAMAVCLAIASIQFVSCKKDAAKSDVAKSAELVQNDSGGVYLDSGLVAWYTFNGDIKDHSKYHNDIVFNSAQAVAGMSGAPKTAYRFDGIGNYMMANDSISLSPRKITLYALFKPKGFYAGHCHYNSILSKGYDYNSNGRYSISYSDQAYYNFQGCDEPVQDKFENLVALYGDGSVNSAGAFDSDYINVNQWYSVVYTYNGIVSKLYVNGVLVVSSRHTTAFNRNTSPLYIGRNEDAGNPYYFNGIIDEIRIYNRALNRDEVKKLYQNTSNS